MKTNQTTKALWNVVTFIFQLLGFIILGTLKIIGELCKVISNIIDALSKKN